LRVCVLRRLWPALLSEHNLFAHQKHRQNQGNWNENHARTGIVTWPGLRCVFHNSSQRPLRSPRNDPSGFLMRRLISHAGYSPTLAPRITMFPLTPPLGVSCG
jgi:hypothetical protein